MATTPAILGPSHTAPEPPKMHNHLAENPHTGIGADFQQVLSTFSNVALTLKPVLVAPGSANSASSAATRIASLLQSGVPLKTIVSRIASLVSSSVHRALPKSLASASGQIDSSLLQSLTNALSPPTNAPPGSAAEQADALVSRLQQWLTAIARGAEERAGQQSDISGHILDANSAKEIPAHQDSAVLNSRDSKATSIATSGLDTASLTQSLLASVAASLSPAALSSASGQPSVPVPTPDPRTPDTASATIGSAHSYDLLGRMIARAARQDVQLNAPAIALATSSAQSGSASVDTSATDGSGASNSQSTLAARFAASLADFVASATGSTSSDGGSTSAGFGSGSDRNASFDTAVPARASHSDANTTAFSATSAPTSPTLTPSAPTSAAAPVPFDPTMVVEQMVKGMSLRTLANGTSEIRLHLSPENLGELSMKLTVQGSSINATVIAQNADVRSALMNGHQQLARSMSEAGMTLSGFSVDVSGGGAGNGGNPDHASGFGRHYMIHEFPTTEESAAETSSVSGPPLVSGSALELFNYLV